MNETEMADGSLTLERGRWLAENILGLVRVNFVSDALKDSCEEWVWFSSDRMRSYREKKTASCLTIIEYLKTPDGFFAVWDAVEDKYHSIGFWHAKPGRIGCGISSLDKSDLYYTGEGYGKDRYEAFYNAVYEAYVAREQKL